MPSLVFIAAIRISPCHNNIVIANTLVLQFGEDWNLNVFCVYIQFNISKTTKYLKSAKLD